MNSSVLLPTLLLGSAGFLVPLWTVPRSAALVSEVTRGIALAALMMFALAFFMAAWIFAQNGADLRFAVTMAPLQTFSLLAVIALKSALIWLPILAFMWVHLSTKANKLAGEMMAREGRTG